MGRSRSRRPVAARESAADQLRVAAWNLELAERRVLDGRAGPLLESVADLEQRLIDPGWQRFTAQTEQEFTDAGRKQMRSVCRLMSLVNPLLVRALGLRSAYVHGQGVQITARANGKDNGEQDVNQVVTDFLTDEGNSRAYTGAEARDRLEHTLGTDGEFFPVLVTRPLTGTVQVRVVLADDIADIINNPEDRTEPWFYRRRWVEQSLDPATGATVQTEREVLHPAVNYRPASRPRSFGKVPVAWDKPMLHVSVNRPEHWQHGTPDVYAAINWARAYKTFLEQWASLVAALSKFAWRTTADGSKQARQIRASMTAAAPRFPGDDNPNTVGGTAITGVGHTLEAIPKSGATIDAESGRPLAMMVAAALGIPVTMLLSDPGQTGARATAETLDLPTELTMGQRREVWTHADNRILRYVIAEAVRAPRGPLKGKVKRDKFRDTEVVELAGDTDPTIDIVWPDLSDTTVKEKIDAVVSAAGTGTVPPELILKLTLDALGVRNAATIIEQMLGDDGEFQWPPQPGQQAGQPDVAPAETGQQPGVSGSSAPADATPGDASGADPLAAAMVEHAASGDWTQLDADRQAIDQAEQANAAPAADLPPHWADETAVDNDWRIDAALARGADIAAAYGSQAADSAALQRGFDIAAADAQLTGSTAPTLEQFTAAAKSAGSYQPTVQLDNRIASTAFLLGRYAGVTGQPVTACPYLGDGNDQAPLRRVWLSAYLRVRPAGDTSATPAPGNATPDATPSQPAAPTDTTASAPGRG